MRLAENAGEARAYRSQTRPDLVLLDIWMPDTDGITLLKEWASAGLLTMPVVMMSGHGTIDTAVEATRIGAFDFLEKPIALQKLLATVGRALKHGGEQRAAGALARHARARAARRRAEAAPRARRRPARAAAAHRRARLRHRAVRALSAPAQHAVGRARFERHARRGAARAPEPGARRQLFLHGDRGALEASSRRGCCCSPPSSSATTCAWSAAPRASSPSWSRRALSTAGCSAARGGDQRSRLPSLREHREDVPDLANLMLSRMVEAKEAAPRQFSTAALNALRNYDWPGNLAAAAGRGAHAGADRRSASRSRWRT